VDLGLKPNRKFSMESRLKITKMLKSFGFHHFLVCEPDLLFFSFAGRKASTSIFQALRPERCGLTEKWNTFLFAFQAVRPEMHTEIQPSAWISEKHLRA